VKTGPERVKLKNLQCQSRCQGTAGEDTMLEKDLAVAVVICELWRLAVAL
jgi:hypothetical protein